MNLPYSQYRAYNASNMNDNRNRMSGSKQRGTCSVDRLKQALNFGIYLSIGLSLVKRKMTYS